MHFQCRKHTGHCGPQIPHFVIYSLGNTNVSILEKEMTIVLLFLEKYIKKEIPGQALRIPVG